MQLIQYLFPKWTLRRFICHFKLISFERVAKMRFNQHHVLMMLCYNLADVAFVLLP